MTVTVKIESNSRPSETAPSRDGLSLRRGLAAWGQGIFLLLFCLLAMVPAGCRSAKEPEEKTAEVTDEEDDNKTKEKPFSWTYSPYDVHVWVAMGPSARLTERHREDIQRRLAERALTWAGYGWKIDSDSAPLELNTDLTQNLDLVTVESVVSLIRGPQPKKKTAAEKAAEKKAAEEKAAEEKAAEEKTAEEKAEEKTAEEKTAEEKADEEKADEEKADEVVAKSPYLPLLKKDKLFLLGVTDQGSSWRVQVRELDLHTRTLSPLFEREVLNLKTLADKSFDAIAEAFHPIARIESSEGKSAELTVRAGGLVQSKESPLYIGSRAVLRPVIRRNNRIGEPLKAGVVEVDWTYIFVDSEERGNLQCQVWSAMRNPVAGRISSRTQRFGLLVRPTGRATQLQLVAQDDATHSLKGYDVFAKTPQPQGKDEKLAEEEEAKKLGQTDWRGVIEIEPIKSGVRVIYVRNGRQLLARLPMVPGYYPEQTATLPNDDSRLKVESYVTGIQNSLLDLVIQQKVLEIRIQGKIKEKKYDEANTLLDEFRELTSLEDLEILLQSKEREIFATKLDSRLEGKITQLFQQTRNLMAKYLDPELESKLVQQLAKARGR